MSKIELKEPQHEQATTQIISDSTLAKGISILAELTLNDVENTKAYYSERYGWTLRKIEPELKSVEHKGYTGSGLL